MIAVSAAPMSTMPPVSSRIPGWATVRGSTRTDPMKQAMPIGTLMRNTSRQPMPQRSASTRPPARIGAATAEKPIIGPKTPKTLGISSSAKTSFSMPKPCGIISAPNPPCRTRKAISTGAFGATAQAADITVKPAEPIRNRRRRPNMSPSRAPVMRNTANASV